MEHGVEYPDVKEDIIVYHVDTHHSHSCLHSNLLLWGNDVHIRRA